MELLNEWWPTIREAALAVDPIYWASGGGLLLVLITVFSLRKKTHRKRLNAVAPRLQLQSFQVAPLGRDAFFKLRNGGEPATISSLTVTNRNDIKIKNSIAGHQLEKDREYSILLEAVGAQKIDRDLIFELTYVDQLGNVYQQSLQTGNSTGAAPKIKKKR
jgi:hypothetical protein